MSKTQPKWSIYRPYATSGSAIRQQNPMQFLYMLNICFPSITSPQVVSSEYKLTTIGSRDYCYTGMQVNDWAVHQCQGRLSQFSATDFALRNACLNAATNSNAPHHQHWSHHTRETLEHVRYKNVQVCTSSSIMSLSLSFPWPVQEWFGSLVYIRLLLNIAKANADFIGSNWLGAPGRGSRSEYDEYTR